MDPDALPTLTTSPVLTGPGAVLNARDSLAAAEVATPVALARDWDDAVALGSTLLEAGKVALEVLVGWSAGS